ncbi:hypothetical protein [Pantoea sp. SS70]|uniref:hypothetical protein n=1 Tax=Pantoea sp. SS70 TaxID=3024247 RepID=UPI002452E623|nr:hypothetical protein [Pantoea sp. SS70]WGK56149.1 hypothetical protein PO881_13485 [Pantoea sp. SS70]
MDFGVGCFAGKLSYHIDYNDKLQEAVIMEKRVSKLEADIDDIKTDMAVMKTDIAVIKSNYATQILLAPITQLSLLDLRVLASQSSIHSYKLAGIHRHHAERLRLLLWCLLPTSRMIANASDTTSRSLGVPEKSQYLHSSFLPLIRQPGTGQRRLICRGAVPLLLSYYAKASANGVGKVAPFVIVDFLRHDYLWQRWALRHLVMLAPLNLFDVERFLSFGR